MTTSRFARSVARHLAIAATAALPLAVHAQEACGPLVLKNPALRLDEAYRMAEERAKAWKADVATASIANSIHGPLKPDGSSEAWSFVFYSPSANAHVAVDTFRGKLSCWAQPGSAGRLPDLKPGFVLDGARLFEIAKKHGEKPIADGYFVMIATAARPSTRHATWALIYSRIDGRTTPPTVIVDANTGAVEKVLK